MRLASVEDLTAPEVLSRLLGPVSHVSRGPLRTSGYSGAWHERVEVTLRGRENTILVLKHSRPAENWEAVRTGDTTGREVCLLGEPRLAPVWDAFACPYRAYAGDDGDIGLLMDDLTPHLFRDMDEPISLDEEERLLGSLASLHARFWDSAALDVQWLNTPPRMFGALGPGLLREPETEGEPAIFAAIRRGWLAAFKHVPAGARDLLQRRSEDLAAACEGLPRTLLHGDAKVANFAVLPNGRVAAYDWEWAGSGPATLDLGWYLAVNASRLARPKDVVVERYRALLEASLGWFVPDDVWDQMLAAGILCGAMMLLWSKALALEDGRAGAAAEWEWWATQLEERWVRAPVLAISGEGFRAHARPRRLRFHSQHALANRPAMSGSAPK